MGFGRLDCYGRVMVCGIVVSKLTRELQLYRMG